MKFTLPEGALPLPTLSPEREAALLAEIDSVVHHTLELRSAFTAGGRQLDTEAWKLIKTKEDVRAYRSRSALHGSASTRSDAEVLSLSSSSSSSAQRSVSGKMPSTASTSSSNPELRQRRTSRPPAVVISGTLDGTIEDAALGLLADTEQRWKVRNSYLGTDLDDARLLFNLERPTKDDPFRFACVKWGLQPYGRFAAARDFVFLEATGMVRDSNGNKVIYGLRQSVDLTDLLTLPRPSSVLRGHTSACHTFMKSDVPESDTGHHSVELFCRAFLEMDGDIPPNMATAGYAEKLMLVAKCMECANAHKLSWLLEQSHNQSHSTSVHQSRAHVVNPSHCANCTRSLNKLTNLLTPGGTCQICRRVLCGKCSVNKKISVSIGGDVLQKGVLFCLECMLEAKHLSSRRVAMDLIKH